MSLLRSAGYAAIYLWVLPNTLIGLLGCATARLLGARWRVVDGVLEATGPGIRALLERLPAIRPISAITLGHVVLARDAECLERTREHERIHVEQYQRWGPLFLPAYGASSLIAWLRGGDPYLDNQFEREAFEADRCPGNDAERAGERDLRAAA